MQEVKIFSYSTQKFFLFSVELCEMCRLGFQFSNLVFEIVMLFSQTAQFVSSDFLKTNNVNVESFLKEFKWKLKNMF